MPGGAAVCPLATLPLVGVSKRTLDAWKHKFETQGPAGLVDASRGGPSGSRLPEATRRAILMLKEANPEWGPKRIAALLPRGPGLPASPEAVARVLREAGYELEEPPTRPHAASSKLQTCGPGVVTSVPARSDGERRKYQTLPDGDTASGWRVGGVANMDSDRQPKGRNWQLLGHRQPIWPVWRCGGLLAADWSREANQPLWTVPPPIDPMEA
jgi:transposase